jgi:hypothetical protein
MALIASIETSEQRSWLSGAPVARQFGAQSEIDPRRTPDCLRRSSD